MPVDFVSTHLLKVIMGQASSLKNTVYTPVTEEQETEMQFPCWREAPPFITEALHDRNYESLISCITTVRVHAIEVRRKGASKAASPCHWCGSDADDWCEHCHDAVRNRPAHMLCHYCDLHIRACRLCRLQQQLKHRESLPSSHNVAMSAYGDTWHCAACGIKAAGLQLCGLCKVARYCGPTCQKHHWTKHKRLCRLLREQLPIAFVYSWHMSRAEEVTRQAPSLLPPIISLRDLDEHGRARPSLCASV